MTFRSTPRMWTLNSSSWVPANTVRPTPTIPGFSFVDRHQARLRAGDGHEQQADNEGEREPTGGWWSCCESGSAVSLSHTTRCVTVSTFAMRSRVCRLRFTPVPWPRRSPGRRRVRGVVVLAPNRRGSLGPRRTTPIPNARRSASSAPVEEALFAFMDHTTLRHRDGPHDGRPCGNAATGTRTPTWSSCASTRWTGPTWPARSPDDEAPVIVTCRPTWEGGTSRAAKRSDSALLDAALEARRRVRGRRVSRRSRRPSPAARHRDRVLVSMHDFDGVPADLDARVDAMRRTGAGIVKVAVMAHRLADCLPLLGLAAPARRPDLGAGDGRGRPVHARPGRPLRLLLDLRRRRRRRRARAAERGPHAGRVRLRPARPRHRALRRRRPAGRATRCRRPCTTPRSGRPGSTRSTCRCRPPSVDDFVAFADAPCICAAPASPRRSSWTRSPWRERRTTRAGAPGRSTRCAATATALGGTNTDVAGFLAPLAGRLPLAGGAGHGARRRRRGALRGGGAGRRRRARHRRGTAPRAGRRRGAR